MKYFPFWCVLVLRSVRWSDECIFVFSGVVALLLYLFCLTKRRLLLISQNILVSAIQWWGTTCNAPIAHMQWADDPHSDPCYYCALFLTCVAATTSTAKLWNVETHMLKPLDLYPKWYTVNPILRCIAYWSDSLLLRTGISYPLFIVDGMLSVWNQILEIVGKSSRAVKRLRYLSASSTYFLPLYAISFVV